MSFSRVALAQFLILSFCALSAACVEGPGRRQARIAAHAAATSQEAAPVYRVSPGDTLKIEFPFSEELNRSTTVRPDGIINLPLINEVNVAGLSLPEVRHQLTRAYTGTLKTPKIGISLETLGNYKVYVGGEVATPGAFPLGDGVTALRAIAMAGGVRQKGGLESVLIIRDNGQPSPEFLLVDLGKVLNKMATDEDLPLQAKDIVFVPKSKIGTVTEFIDQYTRQIVPFTSNVGVSYNFPGM